MRGERGGEGGGNERIDLCHSVHDLLPVWTKVERSNWSNSPGVHLRARPGRANKCLCTHTHTHTHTNTQRDLPHTHARRPEGVSHTETRPERLHEAVFAPESLWNLHISSTCERADDRGQAKDAAKPSMFDGGLI